MKTRFVFFLSLGLLKTCFIYAVLLDSLSPFRLILTETGYLIVGMSLLVLISPKRSNLLLMIFDFLLSFLYFSFIVYHRYFNQIPTYHAFASIKQVSAVSLSIFSLIRLSDLLLFIDLPFFIMYVLLKRKKQFFLRRKPLIFLFVLGLIWSSVSYAFLYQPSMTQSLKAIAYNGLFNYELHKEPSLKLNAKINKNTFNKAEQLNQKIRDLKGISLPKNPRYFAAAKKDNLVVIQVEAMQNFVLGLKVNGQEVTPFLNQWINEQNAIYFDRVYQQIAPGNTSDAEFMINTSIYPNASEPTTTAFETTQFSSLPKLLKKNGYTTVTMHVDDIHFWNRNQLYPALGFDKYYDKTYFGSEDMIGMGASDRVLFTKGLDALTTLPTPFYAHLITLSSHHPFKIPERYQELKLPKEMTGTLTGNYLESMRYVDHQIKQFVNGLKEKGFYDHTVIAIYGDHFGLSANTLNQNEKSFLQTIIGHPYTFMDQFNIPLIIHVPNVSGGVNHMLGTQTDFLPTFTNVLGIPLNHFVHFGDDLLNIDHNFFGMRYYLPTGSFFTENEVFVPGVGFEDGKKYDLISGKEVRKTQGDKELFKRIVQLEALSDDYLRALPKTPPKNSLKNK